MEGIWGNIRVAHEGLAESINAVIPMAEHVSVSVDRPIRNLECVEPPVDLRVQDLSDVVKAMQLMPDVQFDQVILCSRNGEGRNGKLQRFLSSYFRDTNCKTVDVSDSSSYRIVRGYKQL